MKKKFRAIIEELGHKTQVRKELVSDLEKNYQVGLRFTTSIWELHH